MGGRLLVKCVDCVALVKSVDCEAACELPGFKAMLGAIGALVRTMTCGRRLGNAAERL